MRAVKSSGRGHGSTVLASIGRTSRGLIAWPARDRDFEIVSGPAAASIGEGISATTAAFGVSATADYGDAGCPANPRCANVLRNPATWPRGDWFGIGGNEQVRLYLAGIESGGAASHTLEIALDAPSHARLLRLTSVAKQVIATLRLPQGMTGG